MINNRRLVSTTKYYRNLGSVRKRQIFHNSGLGVRISSNTDSRKGYTKDSIFNSTDTTNLIEYRLD